MSVTSSLLLSHTHTHTQLFLSLTRYQRGRYYRGWGICTGVVITATLIILLTTSLSIRYSHYDSNEKQFAPGDTRILSYSSSFCDGLTLSGSEEATLYLLQKKPALSGPNNTLTVNPPNEISADTYRYLYYYLHYGSILTMTYCVDATVLPTPFFTFNLIKGSDNFDDWKGDGDSSHTLERFSISNLCSSSEQTFSYTVTSGDSYYFAFDNNDITNVVPLKATLMFNRTEYLPNSVPIQDSCSIFTGSCSVSVPYNSDDIALIEVGSDDIDPEDNVSFTIDCNPRASVYVLIVLLPLLFVVIVMIIVITLCVFYARKRSQRYANLPTATDESANNVTAEPSNPEDANIVTTVTVTTPSAPPPAKSDYSPAPPNYGATSKPPPYYNPDI